MSRIPFPVTHDAMVANLTAIMERATNDQFDEGVAWYGVAQSAVVDMAARYNVTGMVSAGVIAALSPRTMWSVNVAAAEHMLATDGEHYPGAMASNETRALRVMRGADPLKAWSPRTAPKIRSFYRNLIGDMDAVTVDVWASAAALCPAVAPEDVARVLARVGAYEAVSGAYRTLAGAYGVTPAIAQAVVWVVYRHEGYVSRMNERMGRA